MNINYNKEVIIELLEQIFLNDFNNCVYFEDNVVGYKIEIPGQPKDCTDCIIPQDTPNYYTIKFTDNTFADISIPTTKCIFITTQIDEVTKITLGCEVLQNSNDIHKIGLEIKVNKKKLFIPYKKTQLYYLLKYPITYFIDITINNLSHITKYELNIEEFNSLMSFYYKMKQKNEENSKINMNNEISENITKALNKYEIKNRNII